MRTINASIETHRELKDLSRRTGAPISRLLSALVCLWRAASTADKTKAWLKASESRGGPRERMCDQGGSDAQ